MSCDREETSDGGGVSDACATVAALKEWVRDFSRARDWEQFHHPKDLALALGCEMGEVFEHFRYRTDAEIDVHLSEPRNHVELAHELADCLWILLRLADVCDVDLARSLREKLVIADRKYPVDLSRGRADKYTAYVREPGMPGDDAPVD